jgi:hypothetical protein
MDGWMDNEVPMPDGLSRIREEDSTRAPSEQSNSASGLSNTGTVLGRPNNDGSPEKAPNKKRGRPKKAQEGGRYPCEHARCDATLGDANARWKHMNRTVAHKYACPPQFGCLVPKCMEKNVSIGKIRTREEAFGAIQESIEMRQKTTNVEQEDDEESKYK